MKVKITTFLFTLFLINSLLAQTVVIDPGHGYCANGDQTSCGGSVRTATEILTNMSVGSKLKVLLNNNCSSVTAHLTRTSNANGQNPTLSQRSTMSNNWNADRFLSIHCNGGGGSGSEAFWCNNGPSNNAACQTFSNVIQNKIIAAGSFSNRRVVECRPYLSFHLGVLTNLNAVHCLSEIGFVDNASDKAKLESNTYRNAFAQAYLEAFQTSLGFSCTGSTAPTLNCSSAVPLTCGTTYSGSASTAPSVITTYGCNNWTETGPERVHKIVANGSGKLVAKLTNYTGDLDVYILGSCDPSNCLGTVYSDSAVYNNAIAGQTYYIVVDADDGSGSAYNLTVTCPTPAPQVLNCANAVPLTCGVTYSGAASTAPSAVSTYGCAPSINSSGPERVHKITPTVSGSITATVSNYAGNLDVYILGSCDPTNCLGTITYNTATLTNAIAGQTYYIVVDAADGSGSSYDLKVDCPTALNCSNAIPVECGVTYSGVSSTASSTVSSYGCNNSIQNGPERVHAITPLSDGSITAVVSNFTGDLDVFVLESCNPANCSGIVFQDSVIFGNVVAGQTYYIVVDSDNGSGSSYDLIVKCRGISGNNEDVLVTNPVITPTTVAAGGIITTSSQHEYTGNLYTTDLNSVNLGYFISTDCVLSNDDIYLGGSISSLGVDAPSSFESINIAIPTNTLAGNYYILFVGDHGNTVVENNETNNVSCVQITVSGTSGINDISLSNVSTSTDSIVAGETIHIAANQLYSGNQTASNLPNSELNYYLSTDCILSPDDIQLGDDISNLGSDIPSSYETESLIIPINTESGIYYILFVADDNNAITETDETNNLACVQLVVDGEFVSLNEQDLRNTIELYPNPTDGILSIRSSTTLIKTIEIYNNLGILVQTIEYSNQKIDLTSHANGFYFIKIISDNSEHTTFKVTKL